MLLFERKVFTLIVMLDIARAFAQCNRIRHLFSQGLFLIRDDAEVKQVLHPARNNDTQVGSIASSPAHFSHQRHKWMTIAKRALALVAEPSAATEYLGLTGKDSKVEKWGQSCYVIVVARMLTGHT